MTIIGNVVDSLEKFAPSALAEPWDNVGLLTGNPENVTHAILLTIDVTEKTLVLAKKSNASLIVSHHPPILKPIKRFTGHGRAITVLRRALQENLSLYVTHTNLDRASWGVSEALAHKLKLSSVTKLCPDVGSFVKFVTFVPSDYTDKVREAAANAGAGIIGDYSFCSFNSPGIGTYIPSSFAKPYKGKSDVLSRVHEDRLEMIVPSHRITRVVTAVKEVHPYEEMAYDIIPLANPESKYGYGAVGNLTKPMRYEKFIEFVASTLLCKGISCSDGKKWVKRIAVMGGSGGSFIKKAIERYADVYVTGELSHHDFVDNAGLILLLDATHYLTEFPILAEIKKYLKVFEREHNVKIIINQDNLVSFFYFNQSK
jgi:dinuclear metal center YbgI/SA1388 family protein